MDCISRRLLEVGFSLANWITASTKFCSTLGFGARLAQVLRLQEGILKCIQSNMNCIYKKISIFIITQINKLICVFTRSSGLVEMFYLAPTRRGSRAYGLARLTARRSWGRSMLLLRLLRLLLIVHAPTWGSRAHGLARLTARRSWGRRVLRRKTRYQNLRSMLEGGERANRGHLCRCRCSKNINRSYKVIIFQFFLLIN